MSDNYTIHVSVEPEYMREHSEPDEDKYVFGYHIVIKNDGSKPAKLLNRHWKITDANGKMEEVHGEGVVGEQPHISPGESFEYGSFAILDTPVGSMQGTYDMLADDGTLFDAKIPAFTLAIPNILH